MAKVSLPAEIRRGEIYFRNREISKAQLEQFDGQEVTVRVGKPETRRSVQQNRFYWGVLLPAFRAALVIAKPELKFVTVDDVHDWIGKRWLWEVQDESTGFGIVRSTSDLSKLEFEVFQDLLREYAMDHFKSSLPYPNEYPELAA